jgi:FkbM family methyltransferase
MVRGSDCDTIQAFSRFYEPETKALLNKILGEGGVFIDAGAGVGSFTLIASKIVGNKGLVVAFEPVPRNYLALLENLRTNNIGNVIAVPYALWDQNGYLEIIVPPHSGKASAKFKTHFTGLEVMGQGIRVRAVTIDYIVNLLRIRRLDLIKIDVEGAEIEVFGVPGIQY